MIIIILILGAMFVYVYQSSRPNRGEVVPFRRTLVYSLVVASLVFVQLYRLHRAPPAVDYWATGWGPYIDYINRHLAWRGSPHRIPSPGN